MDNIVVKSISEFLTVIENFNMSQYIYRGQNEPYFSITANGFRPYLGGWHSDKIYDIPKVSKEFYNKVISKLSIDEKNHFLAYCQHYGIPTNLVDFTDSPLVALFFACDNKSERVFSLSDLIRNHTINELEKDSSLQSMLIHNLICKYNKNFYSDYAQVYLIDKDRLIDISDLIAEIDDKNFFDMLLNSKFIQEKILSKFQQHFSSINNIDKILKWIKNISNRIIEEYNNSFYHSDNKKFLNDLEQNVCSIEQCDNDNELLTKLIEFQEYLEKNESIEYYSTNNIVNICAKIYLLLLMHIIKNSAIMCKQTCFKLDIYFTYQPPNLFPRISNQHGMFIYQPYIYFNDGVYDYHELYVQRIIPDITIQIDNYKDILKNLSLLGIDHSSIYGDTDNIAKSVLIKSTKWLNVD